MNKLKKSQILMLSLLAALVIITPLLSSSVRPTYLYFVINLLVIALGAEAGLLSAFSKPPEDKKYSAASAAAKPVAVAASEEASTDQTTVISSPNTGKKPRTVERSSSEKTPVNTVRVDKVKKCPSMPSLFFIGCGETEAAEDQVFSEDLYEEEGVEEEYTDGLSGQELFTKAEMFIGNFYKQLKLQREESWKRIHGFYQKAF
ncbi:DUF4408 domain protein [Melia azedarach]|uniref:DUF4408 domain protein n=1 Tax=Melia azedarach TaxID=155640 RepID=A0ACC1YPL3_MELAZ|nr:DUF4408 domain protein [Melia azedarach]